MSASLVGSEMCIRDSYRHHSDRCHVLDMSGAGTAEVVTPGHYHKHPVSYTHLTLPTICSV
eukprot:5445229-Alexandrium_andersonii.AAC.1